MFAGRTTKTIDLGSGDSVTIKALSGRAKHRSQEAILTKAADLLSRVGGPSGVAESTKLGGADTVRQSADRDPTSAFDQRQVLIDGIVSWSADVPVSDEAIDDLESEIADQLFREILTLSRVPVSAEAQGALEADRKNA